jgi:HAD superfamily phosphoserine phosphatase-like hydrolase
MKDYLLASDFDQTLSFNDSGIILSELLGATGFEDKVKGLARINLVQQGGELAYLLLHDPEYRKARREHLVETGRRIALKKNINYLKQFLSSVGADARFSFHVISAAPEEVIQSALEGIVPPENINGTRFRYDASGEIESILRVPAGYGKVAVLEELRETLGISRDHVIYVGDGSSDVHVMLHVNQHDGLTIAVSEARFISQIARRTVPGDDALCVIVPVLEDALGWDRQRIRAFFRGHGMQVEQWDRVRTDWLKISTAAAAGSPTEVTQ